MASDPPPPYSSPYLSKPLSLSPSGYAPSPASRSPTQPYRRPPPASQHRAPRAHAPLPRRTASGSGSGSGSGYPSPTLSRSASSSSLGRTGTRNRLRDDPARAARRRIATETLAAIAEGIYATRDGTSFNLRRRVRAMTAGVRYYAPDERVPPPARGEGRTEIAVVHSTTLDAARRLERMHRHAARAAREAEMLLSAGAGGGEGRWEWGVDQEKFPADVKGGASTSTARGGEVQSPASATAPEAKRRTTDPELPRIGVLSSAAPIDPSANFLAGEDGQELSIARASTLSAALKTRTALPFYHPAVGGGGSGKGAAKRASTETAYNTHAMVYAPGVSVIRDEQGGWTPPMAVDVITCTAVHAGDARAAAATSSPSSPNSNNPPPSTRPTLAAIEAQIARTTTERLSRVLAVFAAHSVHTLVLPAFGAGNFQNDIASVARIYAALLGGPAAPFAGVFERVVFAITPEDKWREFETAFWGAVPERRRRDLQAGASGAQAQEEKMQKLKMQRGLRPPREDVPENSDGRSIRSPPADGRATATLRTPLKPRYPEDGASVSDWQLNLEGLSIQDGRATVMSRRNNRSTDEGSSSRGINEWRSSIAESQDGALEYV